MGCIYADGRQPGLLSSLSSASAASQQRTKPAAASCAGPPSRREGERVRLSGRTSVIRRVWGGLGAFQHASGQQYRTVDYRTMHRGQRQAPRRGRMGELSRPSLDCVYSLWLWLWLCPAEGQPCSHAGRGATGGDDSGCPQHWMGDADAGAGAGADACMANAASYRAHGREENKGEAAGGLLRTGR